MAYPHPTADTLADGTIHVLGLACFVLSLLASAIYHLVPFDRPRALLGRIDHAAIYFKIAGTYTPLVVLIGTGFAYGILAVVWALAIIGAIAKLSFWSTESRASLYLYLGMGWLSVLLVWPMWQSLPPMALTLIGAGGLIYSLGTVIFAHPGMRFQNAIWHSFVLTASICFFAAISISL